MGAYERGLCLRCEAEPRREASTWGTNCDLPAVNESRRRNGLQPMTRAEYEIAFPVSKAYSTDGDSARMRHLGVLALLAECSKDVPEELRQRIYEALTEAKADFPKLHIMTEGDRFAIDLR